MSLGIIASIAAAFSCGGILVLTKWMMNTGMTSVEVLFYRFLFVFIITGIWFIIKKQNCRITLRQLVTLVLLTVAGYGGSTFLLATSFNFLPMGLATMLYFTYPLFVLVIMTILFKEKLTRVKAVSLSLAILGIFCLMNFSLELFNLGSMLAIGSGLAYAIYLVGIQKSSVKSLDNLVIVFYLSGFSCIFFFMQGLLAGTPQFLAVDVPQLLMGTCIGAVTVFVLGAIAYSIKCIGSTKTSLIISFEAVVSLILGILIFGDPYNMNTWIGSILMTLSVIFITRENTEEALVAAEK
ncbi:MAG: hypothetical protein EUB_00806 [Eubacterium sp.]|uniref:DMT family transporter n=1 Tax=Eubacterium sp. TaxID=142586 RepID=UPI0030652244